MQIVKIIGRTPSGDYERITVTNAAVSRLTQLYREDAQAVFITVETNSIRYRIDGGDPDANNGHVVQATQNIYFEDPASIRQFRAISTVGGGSILIVTYYR